MLVSALGIASIAVLGGWYAAAARRPAERREPGTRLEFLQASLERPEPHPEGPPEWPVLEKPEEPKSPVPQFPRAVEELKSQGQRRISGKKFVEALGREALIFSKTIPRQSSEEFANFLREWTGVDIDLGDKYAKETLDVLRGKLKEQLRVLERDDQLRDLRIRKQLEARGAYDESPVGVPLRQGAVDDPQDKIRISTVSDGETNMQRRFIINSDEFPEMREREQDCKIALQAWLDEVGSYLEAGRLVEKGKPR